MKADKTNTVAKIPHNPLAKGRITDKKCGALVDEMIKRISTDLLSKWNMKKKNGQ